MSWDTKAPGIKEGIFKVTIGRKDEALNPKGIKMEPYNPDHQCSMDSVNTLLSGATFVLSAANLGVSIDSNIRIRDVQNKVNEISNQILGISSRLSTIDNRLETIHIKTEEMHLREAITNATKQAVGNDGSIDFDPYKQLHGDLVNINEAIGGHFKTIRLSSDVRMHLETLFSFLLGLRMVVLGKHNSNSKNPGKVIRGLDPIQFAPFEPSALILETIYLHRRSSEIEAFEEKVGEFIGKAFTFAGDEDLQNLSALFEEHKSQLYEATNPIALEFCILLQNMGIFEKHENVDDFFAAAEKVLTNWVSSDRGLLYLVEQELEGLASGYTNFYPDLKIDEEDEIEVPFNPSHWKAA